jgi:hypothetical protein
MSSEIERKLDRILRNQETVEERLQALELSVHPSQVGDNIGIGPRPAQYQVGSPVVLESTDPCEVEKAYEQIRDTLKSVQLPNEEKLFDYKQGISSESQPTYTVISKCARYVENSLRWSKVMQDKLRDGSVVDHTDIAILEKIMQANIAFLQTKFSSLVVRSSFNKDVAKTYEMLEKGSSSFSQRSLTNLQAAVELQNARTRFNPPEANYNRGRGRSNRGYGGQYPTRGRGDYGRGSDRDVFHSFSSRGITPRRPGIPENTEN